MRKKLLHIIRSTIALCLVAGLCWVITPVPTQAQCPMCKGAAQTSKQEGSQDADGLNTGILYLFLMPYALAGFIGYQWYRKKRQKNSK
jgi:hypothetical protein